MIYVVLYAIRLPGDKTFGGFYYDWAQTMEDAEKIFMSIVLTQECFRKEIWRADGKGYRRLVKMEEYDYEKVPC